jgi:hypothetical protein
VAEPRLHGFHSLTGLSDSSLLGTVLYPGGEDKLTFNRQEAPALISADTEEALAEYRALMASDQTVGLNAGSGSGRRSFVEESFASRLPQEWPTGCRLLSNRPNKLSNDVCLCSLVFLGIALNGFKFYLRNS